MTSQEPRLDGDINYRILIRLTLGLLALVAVALGLMWMMTSSFYEQEKAQDPPPPLMAEARVQHIPPEPRLQSHPFADYDALKARHLARLDSFGWIDEPAGVAHIPIDRAMDLLVANGLPPTPVPQDSVGVPAGD